MAELEPEDEQEGLREIVRYRRSVRLRCNDEAHGEAIGSYVGIIRQSLSATR